MGRKGFTLTELLVVIAILAIMVTIAVPVLSSVTEKAGLTADRTTADEIELSIDTWMHTDYNDETFYRTNLFTSASTGEATTSRIGGQTEQVYSYSFAGTDQLPGVELSDESQIRHSVITAIKATSGTKLIIKNGEQFVEAPKAGAQYGFKYYYKIGRVNVERVDSTTSALGNDEVYRYYVWLDRTGGNIGGTVTAKQYKNTAVLNVPADTLCYFTFDFGSRNISTLRVVVEQEEAQSYSFDGVSETPIMFGKGTYNFYCYQNGELVATAMGIETLTNMTNVILR